MRWIRGWLGWTLIFASAIGAHASEESRLRRPTRVKQIGSLLATANRASGSISLIDFALGVVLAELDVGQRLSDLEVTRHGDLILATDDQKNELVLVHRRDQQLQVIQRVAIPGGPVDVVATDDGQWCSISSLWARQVTVGQISKAGDAPASFQAQRVIDLPFAPRLQHLTPDQQHLIVADAFGGRLAVIQRQTRRLTAIRSLGAHNIGGLAASHDGKGLLIAHQMLNEMVPTSRARVFWGAVVSNILRSIAYEHLLEESWEGEGTPPAEIPIARWSLVPLGMAGSASGDPQEVAVGARGQTVVALAGVNQVAVRVDAFGEFRRLPVQQRPSSILLVDEGRSLIAANRFSDTLSVIDLDSMNVARTIYLGPGRALSEAERGEVLFYDARLSLHGWYSCHSCHTDGHSIDQRNDNLGDDSYSSPKRVLSILGVADTPPFAWNGSQATLRDSIEKSLHSTMRREENIESIPEDARLIAEYLRTLSSPPGLLAARRQVDREAAERGAQLFRSLNCGRCHAPPTYTSSKTFDVGVHDEEGQRRFNPPSLRGVSQRGAYFHDKRAKTLAEVFRRFQHPGALTISESELQDLLEFLGGI